jgi:hypothetical protein
MWIVRLALRRPYTFTVAAIMIVLLGIVTIFRMSTDIFPSINIPVVSVIWSYAGVAPEEMEKRFVTVSERAMTTTVTWRSSRRKAWSIGRRSAWVAISARTWMCSRDFDEGTKVANNPTDDLTEGLVVEPKAAPPKLLAEGQKGGE